MGHPEQGLRGALIAGTNGKGSTAAMLASILQAGGSRTGLMPKPHLVSYRERIQLAGVPISEADFAAAVTALRPQLEEVRAALGQPTEFEILTAVAISYLAQRVDRLVCEVGMGGRLDATNVLDLGVAIVTNVSHDHTQHLGGTLEAIAAEKAAIIKPGNHALTGCRGQALAVVTRFAAGAEASLWRLGDEIRVVGRSLGWAGWELDVSGPGFDHENLRLPLLGSFQTENAALAVAAAHSLGETSERAVRSGLKEVRWPARLEVIAESPRVILDGAHNPEAVARAGAEVRRLAGGRRLVVVFGAMSDKDLDRMLAELRRLEPAAVVFTAARTPRAADPEGLVARWPGPAFSTLPARAALEQAQDLAGPEGIVFACGSIYLAGELRAPLLTPA